MTMPRAAPTMSPIAAACADLCLIADRHVSKLLDSRYSLLPDQLVDGDGYLDLVSSGYLGDLSARLNHTI
jgi:histidine ammonia-lyase